MGFIPSITEDRTFQNVTPLAGCLDRNLLIPQLLRLDSTLRPLRATKFILGATFKVDSGVFGQQRLRLLPFFEQGREKHFNLFLL